MNSRKYFCQIFLELREIFVVPLALNIEGSNFHTVHGVISSQKLSLNNLMLFNVHVEVTI